MKIYIVDDEEVSLFITKRKLILEGACEEGNIHTFLSAEEALTKLAQCSEEELPAVLLLDLCMPVMDGWVFLDLLGRARPEIEKKCRIYIVTSSLASTDQTRAKSSSLLAGLIHKPISAENVKMIAAQGAFSQHP